MIKRVLFLLLSLLCLGAAAALARQEYSSYQDMNTRLPRGSVIADVPVGGLSPQEAGLRLAQAYLFTPVQAEYAGAVMHLDPQQSGFRLDLEGMLAEAAKAGTVSFWDYLNNARPTAVTVPLQAGIDRTALKARLVSEIAPRYGRPATAAQPVADGFTFQAGQSGETLDVEDAVQKVSAALMSRDARTVSFSSLQIPALPPSFASLDPLLSAFLQTSRFGGVVEVYAQDLRSGEEVNLAYNQGQPVAPGIAFTAASTIKIPVMVSAFRNLDASEDGTLPETVGRQMELMIDLSDNGSTDEVMRAAIDENLAPLQVTRDMARLRLENTFLAGMFYPGAPLLDRFHTAANRRADISTDPDPYNQTTAADMGRLLGYIERCANEGTGLLIETFSGEITQAECQVMIRLLRNNRKAVLIEAGLPEGTALAHKYGWVTDPVDGLMHNVSDAAIVYLPQGNFVLSVYVYESDQLLWDSAQALVARLAIITSRYYTFLPNP